LPIEPADQVGVSSQRRESFVLDGRQDGPAEHNLPSSVALALGAIRAREQSFPFCAQAREALVNQADSCTSLFGRHLVSSPSPMRLFRAGLCRSDLRQHPGCHLIFDPGDRVS
jgi:hypothetical protein